MHWAVSLIQSFSLASMKPTLYLSGGVFESDVNQDSRNADPDGLGLCDVHAEAEMTRRAAAGSMQPTSSTCRLHLNRESAFSR
ncbi:hypothetical protein MPC4_140078 [Methylocella tundrae]|uniref:Uncharacterized protein n=1 Tax=Methylocella tundrae TaxID=227605 RepID=A0A8B6M465_METTU|nr:hypothetical protein MPC4_140078 [Methylocella tundrae]